MAEAVVGLLVGKLGAALGEEAATFAASLLSKETAALRGLFGEIRGAKEELESMQAYLQEAERFKDADKTTGIFVNKIRGFAFEIEDVVDEFTYKLQEEKHGGFAAKMKKRIKHIKTWRRLAVKLQEIRDKVQEAKQRKRDYSVITEVDRSAAAGGGASHAKSMNQALHFTRNEDLVGIEDNKEKLTQWLTGDLEQRSKITTVWGMPGVGKTTLVAHVYNTVKVDFDTAAWVTVSESYRLEDLLKKIAAQFGIATDVTNTEMRSLAQTIHDYLQGKKYILVLDDIWIVRVWSEIRNIFPTNCVGRFVITSRKYEVSTLATREYAIHLEPLEAKESWVLFCKGAFWNDDDKECPLELQNLARKFVAKCQGLPIAIACIGRLLSCKTRNCAEWENVYRGLESQLAKDVIPHVDMILKISLEDLPYDLKNCFLHCALFPEDYEIKRRRIMRHWIAAGFIREKEKKTLEEVAEGYLTELVNRSLLQVVRRNYVGRLKSCRMHDVIRLLALNKAKEECFGKIYDGSRAFSIEGTRRISIQSENNIEQLSRSGATHIRALHVFAEYYINIDLLKPILTSSNLLSTLDLQGACIKMLPNEVFNLFNLRYLGLRKTAIESLPEAIGRLQNLEVLDACDTKLSSLPNNVVKLKKLRSLYVFTPSIQDSSFFGGGVKVPNGMWHLTALRALKSVEASSKILREVGALTELRTFGVCNVKSEHSIDLSNAIAKMSHLVHLEIRAVGEKVVLQLEGLCLPTTIYWLCLGGELEKTPMAWSHLNSLTRLHLSFSHMDEESFSGLLVLHGLYRLVLYRAFVGKKLHFNSGSFPNLRNLKIYGCGKLDQVEIQEGAMARLDFLKFQDCPELKSLPDGIEHLGALEDLRLLDTGEELIEKLLRKEEPNKDLMKISHIKKVGLQLTKKGIRERIIR